MSASGLTSRLPDAERAQQLRRRHVDLAGPGAPGRGVVQVHAGVLQRDHAGRAELGGDLLRDLRRGRVLGRGRVAVRDPRRADVGGARRVHDELAGVEVRAGVVEDVAEPGGAGHADDDRDQRAEADRRERRAGPRPVPGQVPQREPHRDRASAFRRRRPPTGRPGPAARWRRRARRSRRRVPASRCSGRRRRQSWPLPRRAGGTRRPGSRDRPGWPGGGSSSARAAGRRARPRPGLSRSSWPAGRRRSRSR